MRVFLPGEAVTASRVRSEESFESLAKPLLPKLYAIARRLAGEEAEDAVQDCLLKGFRRFDTLSDPEAGSAWLVQILVNCCRDRARSRSRHPQEVDVEDIESFSLFSKITDEDPFPYSDSLHLDFLHQFGREDVRAVLGQMPEMYRLPLMLVHMDGFSTKETARILDCPLGTVLARLHRGRKLFEKRLWDYAEEHGLLREGAER